ncbi:DUF6188 family protein [Nocardia flavorosea]|uniref:DUF6188 family protein n=1 Tax=Nocardia flavorosea TaxID=53429 RepID=UPI003530570D
MAKASPEHKGYRQAHRHTLLDFVRFRKNGENDDYGIGQLNGVDSTGSLKVHAAQATHTCMLRVHFESGLSVEAIPDPDHEAWNLFGAKRFRVVCMPGGELGI